MPPILEHGLAESRTGYPQPFSQYRTFLKPPKSIVSSTVVDCGDQARSRVDISQKTFPNREKSAVAMPWKAVAYCCKNGPLPPSPIAILWSGFPRCAACAGSAIGPRDSAWAFSTASAPSFASRPAKRASPGASEAVTATKRRVHDFAADGLERARAEGYATAFSVVSRNRHLRSLA